ncbi:MAG TPA: hypothetical protein PKD51_12170 [Saprospiraceae bacterium]|nr:hypothetical protein [Saprospiraceae bacterium]HMU02330.1 hypothetical protein [Saprospiraceae bacterium]
MIERIKRWFFNKDLGSKHVAKKVVKNGVNAAAAIGIIFDGTSEDDRKIVHKFKKQLNPSGNKQIKSIAFIQNKLPLDNVDYSAYNQKDIKWYGVPFGEKVEEFIQSNFDILIVLCEKMRPHFEFIIAQSNATFIIGPNIDRSEQYFTFIVDSKDSNGLQSLIEKIIVSIEKIAIK